MHEIEQLLMKRKQKLQQLIKQKQSALKNAPDESLRISTHKNTVMYYSRKEKKPSHKKIKPGHDQVEPTRRIESTKQANQAKWVYLNNREHASRIAQKSYDEKVLACAMKEEKLITDMLRFYPLMIPEALYEHMNPLRQKLVKPIIQSDEEYVKAWLEESYTSKGFASGDSTFYTSAGEQMRSKSEVLIAERLRLRGVPYRYECPIYLSSMGTVFPDFHVLNVRCRKVFIYEHFGMMGDPDYADSNISKISAYIKDDYIPGINFVFTMESLHKPLDLRAVDCLIDKYFL